MTAQRGRSYKETAPGCHVFLYWIDKSRAKGLTGEQIQAGPRRSPVGAGDCPERKQKRRIPMSKTFPGEAPEPDSLNVQSGRSRTNTAPGCRAFRLLDRQAKD